jgi:hypothetical protein
VKRYEGTRLAEVATVTVDGKSLDPRFDLANHSPDGFEWGYGGSGPAQLALALLANALSDDDTAWSLHHDFKRSVVANLPRAGWTLTEEEIRQSVESLSKH